MQTTQDALSGLGHLETIAGNSAAIVADFTRYLATAPVPVIDPLLCPEVPVPEPDEPDEIECPDGYERKSRSTKKSSSKSSSSKSSSSKKSSFKVSKYCKKIKSPSKEKSSSKEKKMAKKLAKLEKNLNKKLDKYSLRVARYADRDEYKAKYANKLYTKVSYYLNAMNEFGFDCPEADEIYGWDIILDNITLDI